MNPATGKMDICTEQTDQQVFADYLATNSPDLSRYEYNPWTSEQERHINDALKIMADYMQTGSLQSNLQTLNTPSAPVAGMTVNSAPAFPGATMPAHAHTAPVAPTGLPQVPQGAVPSPAVAPAPAPSMGTFSMGANLGGTPVPASPAVGVISGVDIPTVEPATAPSAGVTTLGGSIGNIDDVIANL